MPNPTDPFGAISWSSEDSEALLIFLKSQAGRRAIFRLRNDRPTVAEPRDGTEASALSAQRIAGYELCIENLFTYLRKGVEEGENSETYPDLDSDAGWEEELKSYVFGAEPEKPPQETTPQTEEQPPTL